MDGLRQVNTRPVLVLGHDGVGAAHLAALEAACDGLWICEGRDAAISDLARAWATLDGFGPLKGHRTQKTSPGPEMPWFGANLTDPDLLLDRMGLAILPGVVSPPPEATTAAIISRQLFWNWEEVQQLCTFFLGALPNGAIVAATGKPKALEEEFRAATGWRDDAVRKAVKAMNGHADQVVADFPGQAVRWDVSDPGVVGDDVRALLGGGAA